MADFTRVIRAAEFTADAILGGCEIILSSVLHLTERAVPFDEARADAWLAEQAEALADREAEVEVAEPVGEFCFGYNRYVPLPEPSAPPYAAGAESTTEGSARTPTAAPSVVRTSVATPCAADNDPEMGVPPAPVSGVGPNSPKWLRDLVEATEDYVGCPRGSLSSPLESADLAEPVAPVSGFEHVDAVMDMCESFLQKTSDRRDVTAILEVLAEHRFSAYDACLCGYRPRDLLDWNAHVAPLIAQRINQK